MLTCNTAISVTVQACTCKPKDQAFHTEHGVTLTTNPALTATLEVDPGIRVDVSCGKSVSQADTGVVLARPFVAQYGMRRYVVCEYVHT